MLFLAEALSDIEIAGSVVIGGRHPRPGSGSESDLGCELSYHSMAQPRLKAFGIALNCENIMSVGC